MGGRAPQLPTRGRTRVARHDGAVNGGSRVTLGAKFGRPSHCIGCLPAEPGSAAMRATTAWKHATPRPHTYNLDVEPNRVLLTILLQGSVCVWLPLCDVQTVCRVCVQVTALLIWVRLSTGRELRTTMFGPFGYCTGNLCATYGVAPQASTWARHRSCAYRQAALARRSRR